MSVEVKKIKSWTLNKIIADELLICGFTKYLLNLISVQPRNVQVDVFSALSAIDTKSKSILKVSWCYENV